MIVAALCWYDEPVELLDRCVRSLAGVADELVALDGRWRLYGEQDDPWMSPLEQTRTIDAAAREAGIVAHLVQPSGLWDSQVVKRDALMELATRRLGEWIFVIDGDEYVDRHDQAGLDRLLAETQFDVVEVEGRHVGRHVRQHPRPMRRLFRTGRGVRVQNWHNGYRASDGAWLHGPGRTVKREQAADAGEFIGIVNDRDGRGRRREIARQTYYRRRAENKIEVAA